jgi:hypothetical protein
MRRAILAAGAGLIIAAPALADEVTIDKKTTTTTTTTTTEPNSGSTVSTVVIAPNPPPPPRDEMPPPSPGPAMVWMTGHWMWHPDAQSYVWVHGKYAEPPRDHAAWIPGHWNPRSDGWEWTDGHWD